MKTIDEPGQSVQRVKVAMTGLALVLLLIGLASIIFSSANTEPPADAAGAAQANVVANLSMTNEPDTETAAPSEPLAELGVAPSTTAPANVAAPAASPTPSQP